MAGYFIFGFAGYCIHNLMLATRYRPWDRRLIDAVMLYMEEHRLQTSQPELATKVHQASSDIHRTYPCR